MNIGKFVLNIVVAFIVYGALYQVGMMLVADQMAAAKEMMNPDEEVMMPAMAYHLVQTVVVVWMFGKAVGSGDIKAGAMFGFMMGLYLMATQATWFEAVKGMPQDPRAAMAVMDIVVGAVVGVVLAFMHGKGWGHTGGDAAAE